MCGALIHAQKTHALPPSSCHPEGKDFLVNNQGGCQKKLSRRVLGVKISLTEKKCLETTKL